MGSLGGGLGAQGGGGSEGADGAGCAPQATQFNMEHFSGMHNWYACSHARPTFCNVCREALSGVTSHGLSCEGQHRGGAVGRCRGRGAGGRPHSPSFSSQVCKFKAHKRCAVRATNNCKWTTLASIGTEIIEDEDGVSPRGVPRGRATSPGW